MGLFNSEAKKLKEIRKTVEKQSTDIKKSLAQSLIETGTLPKVYINVDNEPLYVAISVEDFKQGHEKADRKSVEKVYDLKEVVRHDWLNFWNKNGGNYPKEFDTELANFNQMYGTPYKDFVKAYKEDHSIYESTYKFDKDKYNVFVDEIKAEYMAKYPFVNDGKDGKENDEQDMDER